MALDKKTPLIKVVDYGAGNPNSIARMIRSIGYLAIPASDPNDLQQATHVIIPGVGHFEQCMKSFKDRGFHNQIKKISENSHIKILGVCIGAQILGNSSEESPTPGLGLLEMETVRFQTELPVPAMGWNVVNFSDGFQKKLNNVMPEEVWRFYFSHSYHFKVFDPKLVMGTTTYSVEFPSVVMKNNIIAAQFHPEKSHRYGKSFFRYFIDYEL